MPHSGRPDGVELRLPADSAYASVLRTTTAALAARLDLTLEQIEDLRVVVTEAGAVALTHAAADSSLACSFELLPERVGVSIKVQTDGEAAVDTESFAWQVLTTLAEASYEVTAGTLVLHVDFTGDEAVV